MWSSRNLTSTKGSQAFGGSQAFSIESHDSSLERQSVHFAPNTNATVDNSNNNRTNTQELVASGLMGVSNAAGPSITTLPENNHNGSQSANTNDPNDAVVTSRKGSTSSAAKDTVPEPASDAAAAAASRKRSTSSAAKDTVPEPASDAAAAAAASRKGSTSSAAKDTVPEPVSDAAATAAASRKGSTSSAAKDTVPEPVSDAAAAAASRKGSTSSAAKDTVPEPVSEAAGTSREETFTPETGHATPTELGESEDTKDSGDIVSGEVAIFRKKSAVSVGSRNAESQLGSIEEGVEHAGEVEGTNDEEQDEISYKPIQKLGRQGSVAAPTLGSLKRRFSMRASFTGSDVASTTQVTLFLVYITFKWNGVEVARTERALKEGFSATWENEQIITLTYPEQVPNEEGVMPPLKLAIELWEEKEVVTDPGTNTSQRGLTPNQSTRQLFTSMRDAKLVRSASVLAVETPKPSATRSLFQSLGLTKSANSGLLLGGIYLEGDELTAFMESQHSIDDWFKLITISKKGKKEIITPQPSEFNLAVLGRKYGSLNDVRLEEEEKIRKRLLLYIGMQIYLFC